MVKPVTSLSEGLRKTLTKFCVAVKPIRYRGHASFSAAWPKSLNYFFVFS